MKAVEAIQTGVDNIPGDWESNLIGDLFTVSGGYSVSRSQLSDEGYCYLHYGDIHGSNKQYIDVEKEYPSIPKLNIDKKRISSRSFLENGDIVFVDASEDDEGASKHIAIRNPKSIPFISGLHTIVLKSQDDSITNPYKEYCFLTHDIRRQFKYYAVGTKVTGISKTSIKKIKAVFPVDPNEQKAIAAALSDADALIASLEKLIAKKRSVKQGTMQLLLTGKKRLPGFTGEWEEHDLGNVCVFLKGQGIRKDEVTQEGVGCVRYGEIYTYYDNYFFKPVSKIPHNISIKTTPIKKGDLLFAGSGETAEEIGKCIAYLGDEVIYAGGDIIIGTPSGQDSLYLGHLLNYGAVVKQKSRLGQGDAVVHISATNLSRLKISLPSLDEQRAISQVLFDIDKGIITLENKLAKYRFIKQGMMQELLTSRKRLV